MTKQGLLSYSGTSNSSDVQLTEYQDEPPANLFTLPAGATTDAIPGIG